MTRKLEDSMQEGKSRKRVLKPAVEKKRRDRINQSLAELRSLLLSHTSDPRLQNPKLEKAEILDLAVEFVTKWTEEKKLREDSPDSSPAVSLHLPESPALFSMETAGFQQCVAQLSSYMHRIPPAQRSSLLEGLKHHAEGRRWSEGEPDSAHRTSAAPEGPSLDTSHSPFLPHSCSTPFHDYLSPPASPWLSPYATSPPFPSFASHFSFPPSLSPLSSNIFTFSPTGSHSGPAALPCPPLITLRPPPHPAVREGSPPLSSTMWRPWC